MTDLRQCGFRDRHRAAMPRQAARGLVRLMDRDGIGRLQDAVGVDAARYGVEISR